MPTPEQLESLARTKKNPISPLMQAKGRAMPGLKINFCPFGCNDSALDEHGFCRHVVGITLPADKRRYEPMIRLDNGRRQIRVKMAPDPEVPDSPDHLIPQYEKVAQTDRLVRISTSYRVYRPAEGEMPVDTEEVKTKDLDAVLEELVRLRNRVAELETKAPKHEAPEEVAA
jgi:hypothetical protein